MDEHVLPAELAGLLTGPALPDAACAGMDPLFDARLAGESPAETADRQAAAIRVCAGCPERVRCGEIAERLDRPSGVWAGRVRAASGRPAAA